MATMAVNQWFRGSRRPSAIGHGGDAAGVIFCAANGGWMLSVNRGQNQRYLRTTDRFMIRIRRKNTAAQIYWQNGSWGRRCVRRFPRDFFLGATFLERFFPHPSTRAIKGLVAWASTKEFERNFKKIRIFKRVAYLVFIVLCRKCSQ
jgi:hypothetical protein